MKQTLSALGKYASIASGKKLTANLILLDELIFYFFFLPKSLPNMGGMGGVGWGLCHFFAPDFFNSILIQYPCQPG